MGRNRSQLTKEQTSSRDSAVSSPIRSIFTRQELRWLASACPWEQPDILDFFLPISKPFRVNALMEGDFASKHALYTSSTNQSKSPELSEATTRRRMKINRASIPVAEVPCRGSWSRNKANSNESPSQKPQPRASNSGQASCGFRKLNSKQVS